MGAENNLVTGGNVAVPVLNTTKGYRLSYLRAHGKGAARMQELLLLAKAQGFTLAGAWTYKRFLWRHSLVLFNFSWSAKPHEAKALDDAMVKVMREHMIYFEG